MLNLDSNMNVWSIIKVMLYKNEWQYCLDQIDQPATHRLMLQCQ